MPCILNLALIAQVVILFKHGHTQSDDVTDATHRLGPPFYGAH